MNAGELIEGDLLRTVEDAEAAGKFLARGYADEMGKLAELFGMRSASGDKTIPTVTEAGKAQADKVKEEAEGEKELAASVTGPEGARLLKVLSNHLGGD